MRTHVIPIGNSKGIRIPRALLELCHIRNAVDLNVQGEVISIRPIRRRPRVGWEEAFQKMHENRDDQLLIGDAIDLDFEQWEW